ncbi:MAG: sensor histidine kinase [Candidatus Coatesbacteria bacterium]|nr:sensor histidine kinase [Candidatus Coatesbacteria bacterium]
MLELSNHVLDIAQNSTAAGAELVEIEIDEDFENDLMTVVIRDDGCAMDEEILKIAADPFVTTKAGKKVGLGLPLLAQAAMDAEGEFDISSTPGVGTTVTASFRLSSVDRMPLGNMKSTMLSLVFGAPEIDFVYTRKRGERSYRFDTREVRNLGDGTMLSSAKTIQMVQSMLREEDEIFPED